MDKNRKQEILIPILERFSRILDDIDHTAHSKYKQQLKKNGIASSIQILALNEKLSKTIYEKGEELARSVKPWLYPKQDSETESGSGITAQCPLNNKIIIQYGIDLSKSVFADLADDLNKRLEGEKFIKVGNLKGQLLPQKIELANSPYTFTYSPDEKNAIPFELDDNGRATIDGCNPGQRYYVRIDPFTSEKDIDEWLNGYKQLIKNLSEFLESEWENVHSKRWQHYDELINDATERNKKKLSDSHYFNYPHYSSYEKYNLIIDPHLDVLSDDFFKGSYDRAAELANQAKEPLLNAAKTAIDYNILNPLFFKNVTTALMNWFESSEKTETEKKDIYFFIQDEVFLYIITVALQYWNELLSPKDKSYLLGKRFFDLAVDIVIFIAECYIIGKAIPIGASILRVSASATSRATVALIEKTKKIRSITSASTEEVIGSIPERFRDFFSKNTQKLKVSKVGGVTDGIILKASHPEKPFINVVIDSGNREMALGAGMNKATPNSTIKNFVEQSSASLKKTKKNLDPVSMLTGEELLTLVDDTVFSQFPFVWQRLYRTSAVEFNSGLGYGWSHSLCHTLSFNDDNQVIWQNHENNLITFPHPTKSSPAITNLLSEAAIFLGQEPNHYLVSSEFGIYHFKRDSDNISTARLVAISDKYGHHHNVIYDAEHKLIALELAGGTKRIELTYSEQMPSLITEVSELTRKSVTQEWQFLRQIMHYDYNEQQELIAATNALNHTEQYIYGECHLIAQRKMAGGATFNWQWQGEGKAAVCHRQITNLNGIESRYEWDAKSRKSIAYQSDGTTLTYVHNEQGKLISETNASGQTTTYEYNENGQMTKQTDALGGQTQYFYNKFNKLEAIHTPDGQSTSYYWWGEQISEVMQGKRNWQFRHNEYGDRIEEISPEGKKTQYQYNEDGQCIAVIYPDDTKLTQAWNAQGQRTQTTYPDGRSEHYNYDAQGRISTVTNGQNQAVSYGYDGLGQITKVTYPNKTTREYRYNAYGKVTWFKDESGKVTEYEYASPLHLMTEKRLPNGDRLKFRYDNIHLQMSEIENQKGEVYHLNYTPTGQLSEEIGFDGIKTTYHYDNAGHLVEKLEYGNTPDAKPLVTTYQRDIAGRLAARVFADGVTEQYEYDEYGQLKKVKDGHNVLVWEYNLDGQLTAEHQNWATIRHRYDKTSGLLNGTKLPDGQWLEYHHRNGQLRGITLDGQSLMGMHYDVLGRERERRQGNGLINRYGYDELGKLTSHQIYRGFDIELDEAPQPVWQQQYQYESDGQLAQINGNQARSYRYDKLGQLQTVSYPQPNREQHHAEKVELFSYDATGNKINETQSLAKFEANVSQGNRLLFFSDKHFEYDRFGNLTKEKRGKNQSLVTHYEYDCRHRLIKVIKPSGQTITYTYDPFNRRTSKTVNGKTTEFLWQGNKLIAETDNDKHWQSYLYEPDSYRPLALVQGNAQQGKTKLYWYQNDQLGTPTRLTDGFGETVYECEYNAYGQIIDETYNKEGSSTIPDNPLRFQGQYYDEETGLHYNLNRYYDPFIGRYITQDPIKLIGGLNLYQYCPNPVNWVDPLGSKGMPGEVAKEIESISVLKVEPIAQNLFDEIRVAARIQKAPAPETYLSKEYIEAHLAQFEDGVGFFVTRENLERFGLDIIGRPDGQFVMPISEINNIVFKTGGNITQIEKMMGIPSGSWSSRKELIIIKVKEPYKFNLRMATGNEQGANNLWMPGGKVPGDYNEAIINQVPKGHYQVESVKQIK